MSVRIDQKKTIGVIGGMGLLGLDLVRFLQKNYKVDGITRENYDTFRGKHYDVVINANGNSKRFWANEHPLEDFEKSTFSVYKSLFDFSFGMYVFISSPDVYEDYSNPGSTKEDRIIDPQKLSPYGFHKHLGELIVRRCKSNYLILRSAAILGTGLKKGPIFDILCGKKPFVGLDSQIQLVTTEEIANIVQYLLGRLSKNEIYNVGGRGTFLLKNMTKYIGSIVPPDSGVEKQIYEMNVEKLGGIYPLKTSEEYLQEFFLSSGKLLSLKS
ncbi:MAG: NAD-dependent epimerase/dehydratase family protein [bacterium]|nr:NAD-dependent epimerase/dehydratase family protein [bacterium]